jgi:hypothetical protein
MKGAAMSLSISTNPPGFDRTGLQCPPGVESLAERIAGRFSRSEAQAPGRQFNSTTKGDLL